MKRILIALLLVAFASPLVAQNMDDYVELLRSDIKTERKAIITEVMQFTEEESGIFWPIYREYELEMDKLTDRSLALIKEYAEHWEMMTDEVADDLYKRVFKLRKDETSTDEKYYKKFRKEISAISAVKFMQVNRQIDLLIDLQIAASLPLIEKP
jgi:hypothetical protein